ncbi:MULTISPECIES: helix-turn-helix domain-containing protein [Shewanella]|uniref:helix-turn-helix domain-containing protein n=1 Tax=Shewanella TaxID=22 RepID=UPI00140447D3|nr:MULTISPECIES: helix-turn-helix transcriptional regulator [Shewanella]MBO1273541.1 helix-turn-helix transcriptional regulator [Shewanella sp. 4t3-1-2LB]
MNESNKAYRDPMATGKGRKVKPTPMPSDNEIFTAKVFGQAIRSGRTHQNISLVDAAKDIGVHKDTMTRIEQGDAKVSLGNFLSAMEIAGFTLKIVPLEIKVDEDGQWF